MICSEGNICFHLMIVNQKGEKKERNLEIELGSFTRCRLGDVSLLVPRYVHSIIINRKLYIEDNDGFEIVQCIVLYSPRRQVHNFVCLAYESI